MRAGQAQTAIQEGRAGTRLNHPALPTKRTPRSLRTTIAVPGNRNNAPRHNGIKHGGKMTKRILMMIAMVAMATTAFHGVGMAQGNANHPAPDVDGHVWMSSTEPEKRAFLFGAGSAVVLEYHIRDKHSEEPSRFVKGWVEALKDMSWAELANKLTLYYKSNPDKMNRHVFEVIWHEIIAPARKQ